MEVNRIVLDSGALTALARGDETVRRFIEKAIDAKKEVTLPTVVVAESMTGTPIDAPVQRVLAIIASTSVPLSEILARNAGALQFAAGRPRRDTNDAIVVATADAEPNSVILTGDPDDLEVLAAVRGLSRVVSIA